MQIKTHQIKGRSIAEIVSPGYIITNQDEGINLIGDLYFQGFDRIIIHQANIYPDFFKLKTGVAGEVLQKVSNFRMSMFIVGTFDKFPSKSLHHFIEESNKGRLVNFVESTENALQILRNR